MYNVERYLPKCLDSILAQTLDGVEIICVDDGSPDASGEIAEAYALDHSNIKVFHQANGGLGPARNTGIKHATGEYIAFVDSDDWVVPDMYERLIRVAIRERADIVVSGHCDATETRILVKKIHPLAGRVLRTDGDIADMRMNLFGHGVEDEAVEAFPMSSCMSLYSRSFIVENGLEFKNIISEDVVFNLCAYSHAKVMAFTEDTGYRYRKEGQASITGTFRPDLIEKYLGLVDEIAKVAEREERSDEALQRVNRTAVDYSRLFAGILARSELPKSEKKIWLSKLTDSRLFTQYAMAYPIDCLPPQQRVFQKALTEGKFVLVLALTSLRDWLKDRRYGAAHAG